MNKKNVLQYAKKLRSNQTEAEQRLWYFLRANRYRELKFKRQKPIGPYIVDFVCMRLKLVIEVDGGQHTEQLLSDLKRTVWLEKKGFQVMRFWNNQVMQEIESVLDAMDNKIKALSVG